MTDSETSPPYLGHHRCWVCHRDTPILWDSGLDRAYCPLCGYTQPPRRNPNTSLQRGAWTRLRHRYYFLEGVGLDEQRGTDEGSSRLDHGD
jgi:hypothetical protein